MGTRMQEDSPFRETAWDHRLDKMLDDLKTTVNPDEMRGRKDNSLVSSFRNTSRSDSRSSTRDGVEDGGLMKHHHKEFTSPDKSTKIVTDQYEYDSGDPNKFQKKVMKSTYSTYKVHGDISSDLDALRQGPTRAEMNAVKPNITDYNHAEMRGTNSRYMTNGKPGYDDGSEYINDGSGSEVKRIVWRNRFEKTYEAQDGSTPSMTVEDNARRHKHKEYMAKASDLSSIHPPIPPISPGGQSWADPIPLPTPPQVSPRGEPGVAYVYTYGQSGGTQVQHLPPLNYVQVPTGESNSPITSGSGNQPVIYHYSYHYTLQPGEKPPEGYEKAPHGSHLQPALQVAPPPRSMKPAETVVNRGPVQTEFAYRSQQADNDTRVITNEYDRTLSNILLHDHHYHPPATEKPETPQRRIEVPRSPDITRRNINVSVNKSTTHTTHTKDYHTGPSITSTPFPNRDRSISPDRYPRDGTHRGPTSHITYLSHRTSNNDSLERRRKPTNETRPFPDTSPITSTPHGKIPHRIDDLMTSFDSEDGLNKGFYPHPPNKPSRPNAELEAEIEPLVVNRHNNEIDLKENHLEIAKKDESKNVAGPPVYYPPGHHQLFDESMHTMTLKENNRRGMAKWRNEKASGNKGGDSSSESKGGMAMVPVCLPLCCGAACTIM